MTTSSPRVCSGSDAVCGSVIRSCGVPAFNSPKLLERSGLLKTFLTDEKKQLEALDALKEIIDTVEHSENLMWMFLDILWDEDVISELFFFSNGNRSPVSKTAEVDNSFHGSGKSWEKYFEKYLCILISFSKIFPP